MPPKITPPAPGVPITVFGPMTSVVFAEVLVLLIVRSLPDANSKLPPEMPVRLIVCVPVTAGPTTIDVMLLRVWLALDVSV